MHEWKSDGYPRRVRQLRADVTGYEMVVASSNNAAVENVTDELPRTGAIDERWIDEAGYFADLASALVDGDEPAPEARSAWALVAARLGRSANRSRFYSTYWFGKGDQAQPNDPANGVVHGLRRMLEHWARQPESRPDWATATRAFRQAAQVVERMRDERAEARGRLERSREVLVERARVEQDLTALDRELETLTEQAAAATTAIEEAQEVTGRLERERSRHLDARPGLWETLTSLGAARRAWRTELVRVNGDLAEAERRTSDRLADLRDLERRRASAVETRRRATQHLERLDAEARALAEAARADAARHGDTYPGAEWSQDERRRELHAPWQDPDFNAARSLLMLRALDVHRAWLANVTGMSTTMRTCLDVMTGAAPRDLRAEVRRAAWQVFFLAVLLVSTTFASVAAMFHGLGAESLGWLMIDEAGQAAPQDAVGAMWRARRVLAVGDPMQLEPVVTIPRRAQQAMARYVGVEDPWVPSISSVQVLADRVATFGTELSGGIAPVWVSAPLRVHRRCDSPMFEISNGIAYDDLMLRGVERAPGRFADVRPSCWLDVPATSPGSHVQPAEIEVVEHELAELAACGIDADDVIAISPFRAVSRELVRLSSRWPGLRAGTIHTAQGRQAPVVFLVLGGDPSRPGALRWASETPNLLNVATSRAQRRFYVVGDRRRWGDLPYFQTAARLLAHEDR